MIPSIQIKGGTKDRHKVLVPIEVHPPQHGDGTSSNSRIDSGDRNQGQTQAFGTHGGASSYKGYHGWIRNASISREESLVGM